MFENKIAEQPGFYLQNSLENCLKYLTEDGFNANIELTRQNIKKMDLRRKLDSEKVFPELYKEVLN